MTPAPEHRWRQLKNGVRLLPFLPLAFGCAVGPDYQPPELELPAGVGQEGALGITHGIPDQRWWESFNEPELNELLAEAVIANHDLRIAAANLAASRALLREGRFDYFPVVTAQASASREQRSVAAGFAGAPGVGEAETFYDAGFDALWELDLFGRVRRSVEALRGDLGAEEASYRDVLVSVQAEVARTYMELRGQQYRLAVARSNMVNQEDTYELTQALLRGGRGTDLDIARALAQLETTRASIPPIEAAVDQAIHRLGVLTGRDPTALRARLAEPRALPKPPPVVTVDEPEALLRRRPDIRAAEHRLAAATARIGVAVGDLFPKVTLTGAFGYQATSLDELGDSASERYQFGPRITWAAFDLGRMRARVAAVDARADAALATYERTVLQALEETENALARYSRALETESRLKVAADASSQAADLARLRYRYGADSFLTVLDAERRLLEAQDLFAQAETDAALATVAVYKALGGGWEQVPEL